MRLPETGYILGLFGPSRSGKTHLAFELSSRLALQVRHCGREVEARASQLGVAVVDLPLTEHRVVDAETRRSVAGTEGLIVEGRYLDSVLTQTERVRLIHLTCDEAVRALRFTDTSSQEQQVERLRLEDAHDRQLRLALYPGIASREPWFVLDTSRLSVADLSHQVIAMLAQC